MNHQKRVQPAFINPMQCKPVSAPSESESWTFEIKFDGYCYIAIRRASRQVTLFSRHKKVLDKRFPGILDAFSSLGSNFVLDVELVLLEPQGRPSFQVLQNNLSQSFQSNSTAFDLLNRDGETLMRLPIERRRDLLFSTFSAPQDPLRLSPLFRALSGQVLEAVRKLGLEGVVGKRLGSAYEPGERSGAWLKLRVSLEQEFVLAVTPPGAIAGIYGMNSRFHA